MSTQPESTGIGRLDLDLPDFSDPDGPVLMQEDVLQILDDTTSSYQAVGLLARLLRGEEPASLDDGEAKGLATLLECIHSRLFLAVNGLEVISNEFFPQEVGPG